MCNLSKGVADKAMARGRAEERISSTLSSIKSLMKNASISAEQAMTMLDIPEADRQKYRELLERQ